MPRGQRADEFRTKDNRKLPIFIQSELDDYGLTCPEFRTYARIARRAGGDSKATESVPNMAEAFGVDASTVRRALKVLCLCRLISKHERPGWTPEYALEDQDKWRDKTELKAVRETVLHPKRNAVTLVTTHRGIDGTSAHQTEGSLVTTHTSPCSPDIDEGTPVKVLPEGTPDHKPARTKQDKPRKADRFILPPDSMLTLTDQDRDWLKAEAPYVANPERTLAGWYDKYVGNQTKSRTTEEWKATWRSYMRNFSNGEEARLRRNGHSGNGSGNVKPVWMAPDK